MEHIVKFPGINMQYISKINNKLNQEVQSLSRIAEISVQEYANTSCYISAMTIRWLVSDYDWIKIDGPPQDEIIYQVVFGDDEHYITTKTSQPDILNILKHLDVNNWLTLTSVNNLDCTKYKCLYYKPRNNYDKSSFLNKLSSIWS